MTCDLEVQRSRLIERGTSADDARQRIDAQGDIVTRTEPLATRVIDATGVPAATRAVVDAAFADAIETARGAASS